MKPNIAQRCRRLRPDSVTAALCAGALSVLMGSSALAASCQVVSPANTVALVELFTSEGCSSCPPADQWLSTLKRAAGFDKVLPLSMHVNYWDYIGWKDPYADARFTDRQRNYARLRGTTTIYTPQVVLDGQDFRDWSGRAFDKSVQAINSKQASITITLNATTISGATGVPPLPSATGVPQAPGITVASAGTLLDVSVATDTSKASSGALERPADDLKLYLAVFDNALLSKVTRGENAGSTLNHDFVVRHFVGPLPLTAKPVYQRLAPAPAATTSQRGVAAFVQNPRGEVLQATACLLR